MTANISTSFITSFDTLVKKQYQGSMKLKGATRIKAGVTGKTHRFPKINKGAATPRIPQTDVTPMNVGHGFADAIIEDWNAADYSDIFDLQKISFDEKQELVSTATLAMGRRLDQLIIDALVAGKNTTNIVDKAVGGADTSLNLEKMLRAKRFLDDAGVPDDGNRHMIITASALENALQDTEVASADYNILMPLMNGQVKKYAGFNFHMIESRPEEGGLPLATNTRSCFAFHKDAIGLAIGIDIRTEINYVPEKTSTLINAIFSAGSVVIEDAGVYEVQTHEV